MSSRTPRAVALLLLAVVLMSALVGPAACLHHHDDGPAADDGCALCVHLHSPVLVPQEPTAAESTQVRRGRLLGAPVARQESIAVAAHAARGPPVGR